MNNQIESAESNVDTLKQTSHNKTDWVRDTILRHLQELQADYEDFSDEELAECRGAMLMRVNECLTELGETDEDNQ